MVNNISIGNKITIEATVVDFNEGSRKAKVRIVGFGEDKYSRAERYIWINYDDIYKITEIN